MSKSITVNSMYNFVLKVFRLIVPILVGPYIQRLFDVELYGCFNDASTWVDLALVFGGNPGESLPYIWAFQGISVAAGEIVICYTLGMLLTFALYRADLYKKLFPETRTA